MKVLGSSLQDQDHGTLFSCTFAAGFESHCPASVLMSLMGLPHAGSCLLQIVAVYLFSHSSLKLSFPLAFSCLFSFGGEAFLQGSPLIS